MQLTKVYNIQKLCDMTHLTLSTFQPSTTLESLPGQGDMHMYGTVNIIIQFIGNIVNIDLHPNI